MIRKFRDSYFQGNVDKSLPDVSPIQGDLSGMPPALFTVGTRDLLLDDSLFMFGRWLSYGSNAEIIIVLEQIMLLMHFHQKQLPWLKIRLTSFCNQFSKLLR